MIIYLKNLTFYNYLENFEYNKYTFNRSIQSFNGRKRLIEQIANNVMLQYTNVLKLKKKIILTMNILKHHPVP